MKNIFIKTVAVDVLSNIAEHPVIRSKYTAYIKVSGDCIVKKIVVSDHVGKDIITIIYNDGSFCTLEQNIDDFINKLVSIEGYLIIE